MRTRKKKKQIVRCRVCRCSETEPCNPPCSWEEGEASLCTTCAFAAAILADWLNDAHQPNIAALIREARRVQANVQQQNTELIELATPEEIAAIVGGAE
jgi:hypothetical protein